MALYQVNAGDRILAADANQYYQILKGVAASGETVTLIYNAAASLVLQPSSDPSAGTEAVQIKNNAGVVQSALSYDGRFYAADGLVGTPGVAFEGDKDTGAYRVSANLFALVTNGTERLRLTTTGVAGPAGLQVVVDNGLTVNGSGFVAMAGATVSGGGITNTLTTGVIALKDNSTVGVWQEVRPNAGKTGFISWTEDAVADRWVLGIKNADAAFYFASGSIGSKTDRMSLSGAVLTMIGTLTAGGITTTAVQVNTSGPLIYSGSGAPTISAAVKGSLYLRSDGTTTNDRAYIATNTSGTWTALTTVA